MCTATLPRQVESAPLIVTRSWTGSPTRRRFGVASLETAILACATVASSSALTVCDPGTTRRCPLRAAGRVVGAKTFGRVDARASVAADRRSSPADDGVNVTRADPSAFVRTIFGTPPAP